MFACREIGKAECMDKRDRDERSDDPLVRREEQAAAAGSAEIGGPAPDVEGDEASASAVGRGPRARFDHGLPGARAGRQADGGQKDMAHAITGKGIAFLIASEGVEQVELIRPWEAVQEAGGQPELITPDGGEA